LYNRARKETLPLDFRSAPSEELIAACIAKSEESAWVEFVRRFRPLISTIVLRTARHWGEPIPGQLDDLIQDTFMKLCADDCRLLRNFHSAHPNAIFGFLRVVTANVVHDHFKASHAVKRGAGGLPASLHDPERSESFATTASPHDNSSRIEHSILLQEIDRYLVQGVAPTELIRSRRIFWLYYRCGLSARAISALPHIDLTTKGVESTILRLNRLVRAAVIRCPDLKAALDNDSLPGEKGLRPAGSL
jgi:RNA polymerase sigma-70 factor (ECF subfamily)